MYANESYLIDIDPFPRLYWHRRNSFEIVENTLPAMAVFVHDQCYVHSLRRSSIAAVYTLVRNNV